MPQLLACSLFLSQPAFVHMACAQDDPLDASLERIEEFSIPSGALIDSLERLSQQSDWQIVYEYGQVATLRSRPVRGRYTAAEVLDQLLARTGLTWQVVARTVVIKTMAEAPRVPKVAAQEIESSPRETTAFSDLDVREDAWRSPAQYQSSATFGFEKPLIETPRSISVIDENAIALYDLSAIEDLVRVVPGVFTTTRFGIQGSVDIRNVPADTYFRGMKRLTLQGHGRSVLAAMDTIEVVGGPTSPLYGMGKIGGYTNLIPKSGRAKTGGYLTETQGFMQAAFGNYDRGELSMGLGGPAEFLRRFDKQGGYYLYALIEDADSYSYDVPVSQRIAQAALSIDDFVGIGRLETGISYQYSATAGALTGRFTQALVNSGSYIRGTPLVPLDLNGNGVIGYLEMHRASPAAGTLSVNNQPLLQTWAWPLDSNGQPLPFDRFPAVTGIPQSLFDYLQAHPDADPTGLLRAQGAGGPQPISGFVPIGMALDPRTVGFDQLDFRRATAFERELQAHFVTVFADLIFEPSTDVAFKNQLFFDGMDQYKTSNQPFSTVQKVFVVEDKITATWRWIGAPDWLRFHALGSINYRNTVSRGQSLFGDFSSHRTDAMASTWSTNLGGMTPNSTFANGYDNPDLENDGYPWGGDYKTEFSEFGVGMLLDVKVYDFALLLGARIDGSEASNVDYAGLFNAVAGTSASPGRYVTSDMRAHGWDDGASWSISLSRPLPGNIHPYATIARSSIVLDANNNALTNVIIDAGHIGAASLAEAGVKVSGWQERLYFAASLYEQERSDADESDLPAVINAYATATRTRGLSLEFKATWGRALQVSLFGVEQRTVYTPNVAATLLVDARALGFRDVTDGAGNVVYPAEAFLYGGRSRIVLPANMDAYREKQGNPHLQAGLNAQWLSPVGIGATFGGNYFSETCSGRLCLVTMPEAYVFNAGIYWARGTWNAKADALNVTNERYFRARTGETLGDVLAQAMPERHFQLSIRKTF